MEKTEKKAENKTEKSLRQAQGKEIEEVATPRKKKKWIKWVLLLPGVLFLLSGIVLSIMFGPKLVGYAREAQAIVNDSTAADFQKDNNSYIYDDQGNQLAKLYSNRDVKYVKYEDLPAGIMDAFVAIEDKRFYQHHGVDWKSTAKAVYLLVTNKGEITRGGSTITQQLARNVYLSFETSYERKLKEIFLAMYLEKKYSKNQILEFYINNINYSNGYYGIGSAALGYFEKDVKELDIPEITFLCAIPNNPTYYNPRKNYEHTITRRNTILEEMNEQGFLTSIQYTQAVDTKVQLVGAKEEFYNYESSYAIHAAVLSFMQMQDYHFRYEFQSMTDYGDYRNQYEEAYNEAKQLLYTGGYHIYTSINQEAQQEAQKAVDEVLADLTEETEEGEYLYQGSCTVMDNETGQVIAIVGGRSQDTKGIRTLNRAYQSYHQPGSTIKPLIVYTPALENNYTADSVVQDQPITDGPKNSDGKYLGSMTLRRAVELSRNAVAWSLLSQLTPEYGLSFLQQMHFNKIVPDDYYNSASLGGLTYGVNTVEMAGAYCALANSGRFREPTCINRIVDAEGAQVYHRGAAVQIYNQTAADTMTDILTGVAKSGTASGLTVGSGMPVACKTGTTNGQTCGWFCGYTPYYTVTVCVGADTNVELNGLWGSTYPCAIWQKIQNFLCAGKEIIPFPKVEQLLNSITELSTEEPSEEAESATSEESEEIAEESIDTETETEAYVINKTEKQPVEEETEEVPEEISTETETETESENDDDGTGEIQKNTENENLPDTETEIENQEQVDHEVE